MPALTNTTVRPIWCGNDRLMPGGTGMVDDKWMEHPRMKSLLESGDIKPSAEQLPTRQERRSPPIPQPPRRDA